MHMTFLCVRKFALLEKSTSFVKTLDFLLGNGPRYSHHNVIMHLRPLGSPYSALDILTLTPKNFEKLGKNVLGVGPRGPWRQKGKGLPKT